MMKRYLISIVLLLVAIGGFAQGKEPMAFTAFFKNGMERRRKGFYRFTRGQISIIWRFL